MSFEAGLLIGGGIVLAIALLAFLIYLRLLPLDVDRLEAQTAKAEEMAERLANASQRVTQAGDQVASASQTIKDIEP